jgi:hypothetical protein
MAKYYTSPYEKPRVHRRMEYFEHFCEWQKRNIRPTLQKQTTYPRSFSLTPRQRDAIIDGKFSGAEITNMRGELIIELSRETLRIAALNAQYHTNFYVVKF